MAVRVDGVERWEEPCSGVLAGEGEGVMETEGMGGERGMFEEEEAELAPLAAGTTPVTAVFIAGERERLTDCAMLPKERDFAGEMNSGTGMGEAEERGLQGEV